MRCVCRDSQMTRESCRDSCRTCLACHVSVTCEPTVPCRVCIILVITRCSTDRVHLRPPRLSQQEAATEKFQRPRPQTQRANTHAETPARPLGTARVSKESLRPCAERALHIIRMRHGLQLVCDMRVRLRWHLPRSSQAGRLHSTRARAALRASWRRHPSSLQCARCGRSLRRQP